MLLSASSSLRVFCRAWFIIGAGILVSGAARAQPGDIAATLPEHYFPALKVILDRALQQSPAMIEKGLELTVLEAKVDLMDAARWPRLGGVFDYSSNQSAISGNTDTRTRDNGLFYRVELNQALFHWGALKKDSARARIGVAIGERNYAEAYRLLAVGLRSSYLLLITKKAALHAARDRQRVREANLTLARDRFGRGVASEGEVTSYQLNAEENALEVQRLEIEFVSLLRTLARLAGMPNLKDEDVPVDMPEVDYSPTQTAALLARLLRDGAKSSFEVQVFELQVKEADLRYQIARVRQLPKFNASAGHYVENTTNATAVSVEQRGVERQSVGVRAEWSIFDGFATRGAKKEAMAEKRLFERRLASAVERVLEEAQKLERQLAVEAQAVKLTDRRRMLAGAAHKLLSDEVKLGNRPASDLDEATANIYFANATSAGARATLLAKWSEFVSLAGADPALQNVPHRHARPTR
ncbi:MAG TPA: TolC family protein [Opitutaceae bacterium]|nr:TolC family protein [Opitutaceae bacterium]